MLIVLPSSLCLEQLNILLFELSQRLHSALSKVHLSFYPSLTAGPGESKVSCVPLCEHQHPAKLVAVRKDGPNKVLVIPCLPL